MKITVRLFGAFRPLGERIEFDLRNGDTLKELRDQMQIHLQNRDPDLAKRNLLAISRFSDETTILPEDTVLQDSQVLAILPPVSGG